MDAQPGSMAALAREDPTHGSGNGAAAAAARGGAGMPR